MARINRPAKTDPLAEAFKGKGAGGQGGRSGLGPKLLIALWRFVETGLVPQGAELAGLDASVATGPIGPADWLGV
jgi:hypothetical protein